MAAKAPSAVTSAFGKTHTPHIPPLLSSPASVRVFNNTCAGLWVTTQTLSTHTDGVRPGAAPRSSSLGDQAPHRPKSLFHD